ncbi:GNAT family N-acetyltransferase [Streptacidiphilus sp. P02-A3a]|uniref:GNAT family N-acetyltransferase n=1 Tax=Streptacidiphilus sp. P02-A3a TaxID=2704468 RepID=UPI0015FD437B|nr:GNAT family N-acetyltransferase [Streptacidiphilus sp. P02-A3a]QMU72912.1 GNAT family N-acetyltransferase [Streptacidiphilus sp. P02-A3a]
MHIRRGTPEDVDAVLALLDGAVEWLVAQGRTGQWGTEPWSTQPAFTERVTGRAERGELRVAELDGQVAGALSVSETAAAYVTPAGEPELYVNLLATDRRHEGRGVGAALLDEARAEARRRGLPLLRVDCFAGDDQKLVGYYRSQGFAEVGPFTVRRAGLPDWPGMLLAQRLDR